MIQCPRCKRIEKNRRFVDIELKTVIPGAHYRLCPLCQIIIKELKSRLCA